MPVAGISKDTVLDIAGFAVDSNGNVSIKVSLRAGGSLKNGRINGTVRLFSSSSLSGPWIECAAKGNAFSSGELLINHEVGGVKSSSPCFFRVRITENSDE